MSTVRLLRDLAESNRAKIARAVAKDQVPLAILLARQLSYFRSVRSDYSDYSRRRIEELRDVQEFLRALGHMADDDAGAEDE